MRTLKSLFEKPTLIWFLIVFSYICVFWFWCFDKDMLPQEQLSYDVMQAFSDNEFPPRIGLVKEFKDEGHVGYYALMGRVFQAAKGDVNKIRFVHLLILCAVFFIFVTLGRRFVFHHRLNPLWVSLGLLLLALNPTFWFSAFHLDYVGLLLFFSLLGLNAFNKENFGWVAIWSACAVLIDWSGLILPISVILARFSEEQGRVMRPVRFMYYLIPLILAGFLVMAWQGFLPGGVSRQWLEQYQQQASLVRLDALIYSVALLPLYTLWFSWSWFFKARRRALQISAVVAVLVVPLFFVFPIQSDFWSQLRMGSGTWGLMDHGAQLLAGEYKNLVLFIPFVVGMSLLALLLFMDILDRSRCLRFFVVLFFMSRLVFMSGGDRTFAFVIPFIILLSISEAMVGEEGNLMG